MHPQTSDTCSWSTLSELQSEHVHNTPRTFPCAILGARQFKVVSNSKVRYLFESVVSVFAEPWLRPSFKGGKGGTRVSTVDEAHTKPSRQEPESWRTARRSRLSMEPPRSYSSSPTSFGAGPTEHSVDRSIAVLLHV